jgi:hypothetical protein
MPKWFVPNPTKRQHNQTLHVAEYIPLKRLKKIPLKRLSSTLTQKIPLNRRVLKNVNGDYLLGDPASAAPPVLFGLPVVATPAMTADKFLVGAFPAAATIFDRQKPTVELSTEDSDNFRKNLVTIRAEERLAQGIKDGTALVYGDLGFAALAARTTKAK